MRGRPVIATRRFRSDAGAQGDPSRRATFWCAARIQFGPDASHFADGDLPVAAGGSEPVCTDAFESAFAGRGFRAREHSAVQSECAAGRSSQPGDSDRMPALKETRAGGPPSGARLGFSLGRMLVISQMAICLLLLVGASLFVRTLSNLHSLDVGFERENILLFKVNARQAGHRNPEIPIGCRRSRRPEPAGHLLVRG